jgi:trimeric autotransporter adhesin
VGVLGNSGFLAGYFHGEVDVDGSFFATDKHFKIDHPLDPANKYMVHASVESAERMNIYDGTIVLDDAGEATVTLPDWFEALNRDFRYQLTSIGGFAPIYVAEKIHDHRFRIAGGHAGMEVSWQVTGTRHDPYADAHPMRVEEEKPANERGYYLNPDLYGQPEDKGNIWAHFPEMMRQTSQNRAKAAQQN